MKKQFIQEKTFESYFYLIWDCTPKELKEWVRKEFNRVLDVNNTDLGKIIKIEEEETLDFVIWIRHKKDIPALSHELLHMVFYTINRIGIYYDIKSEEVYTYLLTYYMRECLNVLKQKKKRGVK